ncbi:MAG TPA: hypothetical protein VML19_35810 [Verrucomicrobiae bacterium]|nr:hypothetical protein [Verrucomicrobiae bacterium]
MKFGNSKTPRQHFASGRGPTITPPKDYAPIRGRRKPPFHAEIEAASNLPDDSPEFRAFVLDVVGVPANMAPSVAAAIRQQKWKISPNPLASIRTAAHQESRKLPTDPNE